MGRKKPNHPKAMQRAQLIMQVRCGLMTASEAARQLGVSRKTYYKWEQRGLSLLLNGLSDQRSGRPEKAKNPAEAVLEKQLADLKRENELLEQKLELKDLVADFQLRSQKDRTKKK
jgi:transposase